MFGAFSRYMLLSMAAEGVFLPVWSDAMWDEWERVVGNYLTEDDPGDWHVLATAIAGRADVIVTENLSDFPRALLSEFQLSASSLDEFCVGLLRSSLRRRGDGPDAIYSALRRHREMLRRPHPWTMAQYRADGLRKAGLTTFESLIPSGAPI